MRSRDLKFKHMRYGATTFGVLALVLTGLSGCAGVTTHRMPEASAPEQPLAHLTVATPPADHDVLAQLLDAQFAIGHGDLDTAAKAYGRAAALSQDPEVAERAAGLAIATHDPEAARKALARWQVLGGGPDDMAQARAKLALDSGDTDGARQQLERLVDSDDKDAWRKFGRLLMGARDAAQAGLLLKTIATPERLPDDEKAWLAMSEMGNKLRQHAYARDIANEAVRRFHCADCYAWAAQLQYQSGHRDKARELYAQALKKDPADTRLRLGYASLLGKEGDNAGAARLLAKGRQDAVTFQARAAFAARASDMPELRRIYRQLTQASDEVREQSFYLLGQLAGTIGKQEQALDWFSQVPADDEHRFDADMHSALLLQQQGDTARAHAMARQMQMDYAEDPKQLGKALQLDAELYMSEGRFDAAITGFTRALKQAPDDTSLLYGRGLAYAEAGNVDAAIADLRRLLKLEPDDIDAANALGYTLADAGRDLSEAETLIGRAHEARPDDPAITDSWGWLQYRLGHLDKAGKALRKAWEATDRDPEVGLHLAEVLWKQGNVEEARNVLNVVRELAPDDAALQTLEKKMVP